MLATTRWFGAMLVGGGFLVSAGCGQEQGRVASPPPPPPPAARMASPGAPLPVGWAWPFAPTDIVRALTSHSVLRPFDLARVAQAQGSGPCAPVQVAPNVWVSTLCSTMPKMAASPAVSTRMRLNDDARPATAGVVDLRASGLDGPVKNQQMVGVCWSFALSTLMDNALRRAGHQEVMAPMHILATNTWDELFRNGQSHDIVTERAWPYDPPKACELNESPSERWCQDAYHVRPGSWRQDPPLVAEVNQANASGVYRIAHIQELKTGPLDTDHVASILASGQGVYLGMQIDTTIWNHPVQGQIADWTNRSGGGHAIVAVGYRGVPGQRQFLIHNSWGTTWADNGYAWVSEAMVRSQTDESFTVEVTGANGQGLPTSSSPTSLPGGLPFPWPFPGPAGGQPSPGGACPAGQVRDRVLGSCAAACAGGSAPMAGICQGGGGGSGLPVPSGLPIPGGSGLPIPGGSGLPIPGGPGLPLPR